MLTLTPVKNSGKGVQPLQIASIFILFVASAIGYGVPLLVSRCIQNTETSIIYKLVCALGAGALIGIAIIHMLDEGNAMLREGLSELEAEREKQNAPVEHDDHDDHHGHAHGRGAVAFEAEEAHSHGKAANVYSFRWGTTIAATTVVIGFVVELLLRKLGVYLRRKAAARNQIAVGGDAHGDNSEDLNVAAPIPEKLDSQSKVNGDIDGAEEGYGGGHSHEIMSKDDLEVRDAVFAWFFDISAMVHSVIIGIVLGVVSGDDAVATVTALLIALIFHQLLEGVSVASSVQAAHKDLRSHWKTVLVQGLIFSSGIPIGIIIGILAQAAVAENEITYNITAGVLQSFVAGMLLEMAILGVLPQVFVRVNGCGALTGVIVAVFLGVAGMALLSVWA